MDQKTILIIEDEEDAAELFAEMMRVSGFRVLKTSKSAPAIAMMTADKPDIVLLDIMILGLKEAAAQTMVPLVITGSDSWGKADPQTLAGGSLDFVPETDNAGPLTIVVVGEQATLKARLAVFGDSYFASNADFFSYANGDLLVNTIDWASRQESLISLTPKQSTPRFVTPPTAQAVGLIFFCIMLPFIIMYNLFQYRVFRGKVDEGSNRNY